MPEINSVLLVRRHAAWDYTRSFAPLCVPRSKPLLPNLGEVRVSGLHDDIPYLLYSIREFITARNGIITRLVVPLSAAARVHKALESFQIPIQTFEASFMEYLK